LSFTTLILLLGIFIVTILLIILAVILGSNERNEPVSLDECPSVKPDKPDLSHRPKGITTATEWEEQEQTIAVPIIESPKSVPLPSPSESEVDFLFQSLSNSE